MGTATYNPGADPNFQGWNQPPRNAFGLPGGDNVSGSDRFAQMALGQWQDWVKRFLPIENTLIDYSSDVTLPGQNAQKAIGAVQSAYGQQAATSALSMKTAGIVLNPDEQKSYDRERNLSQSLSEVQAANTARDLTVDRQRSIVGVPVNTSDLALRGGR